MTPQLERIYETMKASGELSPAALRRWRQQNRLQPDESLENAPDPARRASGETLEALGKRLAPVTVPSPAPRPRQATPRRKRSRPFPAPDAHSKRGAPDLRSRWDLLEVD